MRGRKVATGSVEYVLGVYYQLGHDVVDGNVCSNIGFIQGKMSNICYKCTDGWIKLVLRSTSFVVPRAQPLCRNRGVGKTSREG